MKKMYIAPTAEAVCFQPVEDLALKFDNLWDGQQSGNSDAAVASGNDIKININ